MSIALIYATVRGRLVDLSTDLTGAQAQVRVPATPEWTVHDVYAHLAGICADVLDARLDGMPGPQWTSRQVRERHDLAVSEICARWQAQADQLDSLLSAVDGNRMSHMAIDVWSHEQDIRAALGYPARVEDPMAVLVAARLLRSYQRRFSRDGLPTVSVTTPSGQWQLGEGDVVAGLGATDFEVCRAFIGRRSRRQMLALDWTGDPVAVLDHLVVFSMPDADLAG